MDLVDQSYWDKSYKDIELTVLVENDPIRKWIKSHISNSNGKCLEIGCFPGGILPVFGELGYELHGIDLTPRVEIDLPRWLKLQGYQVGKFERVDILKFFPNDKYDIVSSFGFIEHFSDWRNMLLKHASLVKKDGFLIIETPNFRGVIQRFLHSVFDKKNYERHNNDSMKPHEWKKIVTEKKFEIVFCGYFGNFLFWVDNDKRNWLQKMLINLIQSLTKRCLKYLPNNRMYSPFCGIICKKL
jgi:2-polyprenyl-3-methyl-5-hydroxy-6-metoxy-1,4-benzoquinol methylase